MSKIWRHELFLSVAPDDENGIEIQALSGNDIDITETRQSLSFSVGEMGHKAVLREKLAFKYPGLAAYYFEHIIDIFTDKVIGWNDAKGEANTEPGFWDAQTHL